MQSNIETNLFTNFLKQGACIRRNGIWTLFSELETPGSTDRPSTIKTQFATTRILRKYYKNQWDMDNDSFDRALSSLLSERRGDQEKIIIDWDEVDRSIFTKSFDLAKAAFAAGKVEKVVPICVQKGRLRTAVSPFHKAHLLRLLCQVNEHLIPYGEWDFESGFLGATPEILFQKKGKELVTMALAGTTGKDVAKDVFFSDPKERREHQFVIEDIVQTMSTMGRVKIGKTEVMELPTLNHLRTEIRADLDQDLTPEILIEALHPTPALGIFPRNSYFETFLQYPLQDQRDFFGAPWGVDTKTETLMLVSIRKWDWKGTDAQIFAGCGVVAESVLEKEFAEILKKIDSVKRIFFKD